MRVRAREGNMEADETLNLACVAVELQGPAFQKRLMREDNTGDLSGPWVSKPGLYGTARAGHVKGDGSRRYRDDSWAATRDSFIWCWRTG